MFVEPHSTCHRAGWIEVVCGSMFSGKTEELIRRIRRAEIANQKVQIFKPQMDTRYSQDEVVSHNKSTIASCAVDDSSDILAQAKDLHVVGIDEVQFFDNGVIEVANTLASQGVRVICAGLDMDYTGKPFGPLPSLLAIAEFVTKVQAICQRCGNLAYVSHRLTSETDQVLLGEKDAYEPRCRSCFDQSKETST